MARSPETSRGPWPARSGRPSTETVMATASSVRPRRAGLGLRQPAAIPSPDLGLLRSPIARTRAVRILLAVLLLAAFVTAFLLSRNLRVRESGFLPGGRAALIVVDMSPTLGV